MKAGEGKPVAQRRKARRLRINWAKPAQFEVPIPREEKEPALHRYSFLETPPEDTFDSVTLLVPQICRLPIAPVGIFLMETLRAGRKA